MGPLLVASKDHLPTPAPPPPPTHFGGLDRGRTGSSGLDSPTSLSRGMRLHCTPKPVTSRPSEVRGGVRGCAEGGATSCRLSALMVVYVPLVFAKVAATIVSPVPLDGTGRICGPPTRYNGLGRRAWEMYDPPRRP